MGLRTQVIGKTMVNGQAGSYARQPDMVINTKALGGADSIQFGLPVKYNTSGQIVLMGAGSTAADFVGITAREIKTSLSYLNQGAGQYAPNDPVPVFKRGCINVKCQKGTAKAGGDVYVRVTASDAAPKAIVGGFEAEADATAANTVKLTNCQWAGAADVNGIAELRIMTIINA